MSFHRACCCGAKGFFCHACTADDGGSRCLPRALYLDLSGTEEWVNMPLGTDRTYVIDPADVPLYPRLWSSSQFGVAYESIVQRPDIWEANGWPYLWTGPYDGDIVEYTEQPEWSTFDRSNGERIDHHTYKYYFTDPFASSISGGGAICRFGLWAAYVRESSFGNPGYQYFPLFGRFRSESDQLINAWEVTFKRNMPGTTFPLEIEVRFWGSTFLLFYGIARWKLGDWSPQPLVDARGSNYRANVLLRFSPDSGDGGGDGGGNDDEPVA